MSRGVVLLGILGAGICRATLAAPGAPPTHDVIMPCNSQDELADFLRGILADAGHPVLIGAALAASGPQADEDVIDIVSNGWRLYRRVLRQTLDTPHVRLVQGVVACALAAPGLAAARLRPLHAAAIDPEAPLAAIHPEAALGVAYLFHDAAGERLPVLSEAGCIGVTPADAHEAVVLGRMDGGGDLRQGSALPPRLRASPPRRGLVGRGPSLPRRLDGSTVIQRARAGDAQALETCRLYSGWLGAFAADVAMIGRTRGGVYLNSHFLRDMSDLLDVEAFQARYLAKGHAAGSDIEQMPAFLGADSTALEGLATLFTPSDARFGQKDIQLLDC